MTVQSFIIAGYVSQILGTGGDFYKTTVSAKIKTNDNKIEENK